MAKKSGQKVCFSLRLRPNPASGNKVIKIPFYEDDAVELGNIIRKHIAIAKEEMRKLGFDNLDDFFKYHWAEVRWKAGEGPEPPPPPIERQKNDDRAQLDEDAG